MVTPHFVGHHVLVGVATTVHLCECGRCGRCGEDEMFEHPENVTIGLLMSSGHYVQCVVKCACNVILVVCSGPGTISHDHE